MIRPTLIALILFGLTLTLYSQNKVGEKIAVKNDKAAPKYGQNPKLEFITAVSKSKRAKHYRITSNSNFSSNEISSVFEYSSPDKYYLLVNLPRKRIETIEIKGQRYEKKDDLWIKTKLNPLPLRETFGDLLFPSVQNTKDSLFKIVRL